MKRRPMGLFAGLAAVGVAGGAAWYFGAGRAADQAPYRAEPRREVRFNETPPAATPGSTGRGAHGAPDEAGARVVVSAESPGGPPGDLRSERLQQLKKRQEVRKEVMAQVRAAAELAEKGRIDEALAALRATYENAEAVEAPIAARLMVIMVTGAIGARDPRAMAMLSEIRDNVLAQLQRTEEWREDLAREFFALNRALGEADISVQFYDALPADRAMGVPLDSTLFEAFVATGRYEDAVRAKPLEMMLRDLPSSPTIKPRVDPVTQAAIPAQLASNLTANLDVLAAVGRPDDLAAYLTRMVERDRSPTTLALLREHLNNRPDAALMLEKVIAVEP